MQPVAMAIDHSYNSALANLRMMQDALTYTRRMYVRCRTTYWRATVHRAERQVCNALDRLWGEQERHNMLDLANKVQEQCPWRVRHMPDVHGQHEHPHEI